MRETRIVMEVVEEPVVRLYVGDKMVLAYRPADFFKLYGKYGIPTIKLAMRMYVQEHVPDITEEEFKGLAL